MKCSNAKKKILLKFCVFYVTSQKWHSSLRVSAAWNFMQNTECIRHPVFPCVFFIKESPKKALDSHICFGFFSQLHFPLLFACFLNSLHRRVRSRYFSVFRRILLNEHNLSRKNLLSILSIHNSEARRTT